MNEVGECQVGGRSTEFVRFRKAVYAFGQLVWFFRSHHIYFPQTGSALINIAMRACSTWLQWSAEATEKMRLINERAITICVLLLGLTLPICAQKSSAAKGINTLAAPVPAPLLSGKRAFISNELGDVSAFPSSYSGGPERAYSEFYDGMNAWGRYELVADPKDADLVFAIRFVDSPGLSVPQIRVGISDARTHVALWGFVEQINPALFKKHRDDAFSATVQLLIADVHALLTPGAAQKSSGKTRFSDEAR